MQMDQHISKRKSDGVTSSDAKSRRLSDLIKVAKAATNAAQIETVTKRISVADLSGKRGRLPITKANFIDLGGSVAAAIP